MLCMSYDERLDAKSSWYRGRKALIMEMGAFMLDNGMEESAVREFLRHFTVTRSIENYKQSKPELRRKTWTVIDGGRDDTSV